MEPPPQMELSDATSAERLAAAIARDLTRFHADVLLRADHELAARAALDHAIEDARALYRSKVAEALREQFIEGALREEIERAKKSGTTRPDMPADTRLDPMLDVVAVRRAGGRMLGYGAFITLIGLALLIYVDRNSGGGVTSNEIDKRGLGLPLLVGFPATIGYVLGTLGLYRLVSGRGPGHDRRSAAAIALRVFGVGAASLVFWGSAFAIVWWLRR